MENLIKIFVFLCGSIIGSFLNVCIFRMPREGYSLIRPSSYCPLCKKPILWFDNIPLASFFILKGRCRFCQERISFQYPLVELLTALTFLTLYNLFGASLDFLIYAVFICGLIVATFIDIRWRIIPDEISIGGTLAGGVFALIKSIPRFSSFPAVPLIDSLLGALLGGALIYGSGLLGNLIIFKLMKKGPIEGETESMGGGDVKLMMMIGSFLGWRLALATFFIAPFLGAIVGIYVLIYKKSHLIPYGPFLSIGALISLYYSGKITPYIDEIVYSFRQLITLLQLH
jgi:leader peptidase (prepilin peptidase)/N-methyltransferase